MQTIILGGGCFWCTEAVFLSVKGVHSVTSGYAGGQAHDANYSQVCEGNTDHAEVIKVDFDPAVVSLTTLLEIFFATHDPTTPNRQGNDVGRQYRSVIFYDDDAQRSEAQAMIQRLQADGIAVVTELAPFPIFYPAESYHQDFYRRNPHQPYCNFAIPPKLAKLRQKFTAYLR